MREAYLGKAREERAMTFESLRKDIVRDIDMSLFDEVAL